MTNIAGRLRAIASVIRDTPDHHIPMTIREAANEIERLQDRLEMRHAWKFVDGKKLRVDVEPGSIPDGIECRDETIRQQRQYINELRQRLNDAIAQPLPAAQRSHYCLDCNRTWFGPDPKCGETNCPFVGSKL